MLLASTNEGSLANSWILDSRCTYHMCPYKEWFCTYQPYDVGIVLMGNDVSCKVIEIGTVKIKMHDGIIKTLCNVRHFPKLKKNLISLETLDSLGSIYFVSFIDDYSRKVWVYFMKHKSKVFNVFRQWKAEVENQTGRKLKCIRSDNMTEYKESTFLEFYKNEGVLLQPDFYQDFKFIT
ncbi:hypothetical protein UlMin_043650 [Ulmus minor]